MKTTLLLIGVCNLVISCTSTHPRTIDLNLIVTKPVNNTETKNTRCDLSNFIFETSQPVDKVAYKEKEDIVGYVKALEKRQSELLTENNSILKTLLKCHSQ